MGKSCKTVEKSWQPSFSDGGDLLGDGGELHGDGVNFLIFGVGVLGDGGSFHGDGVNLLGDSGDLFGDGGDQRLEIVKCGATGNGEKKTCLAK